MYLRTLANQLPEDESYFIFGPRQTGKTTLVETLNVDMHIDLLSHSAFVKYGSNPDILIEEINALSNPSAKIWIDECQKVPKLLETVHQVMNSRKDVQFILTGSSARKLKRGAANLLGGRAIDLKLHTLSAEELGNEFELDNVLKYGSLAKISSCIVKGKIAIAQQLLRSYVTTYLAEEIHEEAQIQNLDYFKGFLEIAASLSARQISYTGIATLAHISQHNVRKYFSVLEDTLIGFFLYPYVESAKKRMSKQPKFYMFDNGVSRAIQGMIGSELSFDERGFYFEQWVIQEVRRCNDYYNKDFRLYYWRTSSGAEVDLLITRGGKILFAVECKSNSTITKSDFSGLLAFSKIHPNIPMAICAPVQLKRITDSGVHIINSLHLVEMLKRF